jgi:hypothetical protein
METDTATNRTSSRWYGFVVLWFFACLFLVAPFGFAFVAWWAWQQQLPPGLPAAGVIRWAIAVMAPASFAASWYFFYLMLLDIRWFHNGARGSHELLVHPTRMGSIGGVAFGICFTLMGIGFLFEQGPNAIVIGLTTFPLGLLFVFLSLCGYLWARDEAATRTSAK